MTSHRTLAPHPWLRLSDMELCHKLCENTDSFMRCLAGIQRSPIGTYIPASDPVTQVIFPFLVKMDRLRLSGTTPVMKEHMDVEHAMFMELNRQFGTPASHYCSQSAGAAPAGGYEKKTELHMRIGSYRAVQAGKEAERKAREEAEIVRSKEKIDRELAILELGEIRTISGKQYIIKDGAVYDINYHHTYDERYSLPRHTVCNLSSALMYLPIYKIKMLRGEQRFASVEDAEAHAVVCAVAIEEARILKEAKRRIELEKQAKIEAEREARVLAMMETLRKTSIENE